MITHPHAGWEDIEVPLVVVAAIAVIGSIVTAMLASE